MEHKRFYRLFSYHFFPSVIGHRHCSVGNATNTALIVIVSSFIHWNTRCTDKKSKRRKNGGKWVNTPNNLHFLIQIERTWKHHYNMPPTQNAFHKIQTETFDGERIYDGGVNSMIITVEMKGCQAQVQRILKFKFLFCVRIICWIVRDYSSTIRTNSMYCIFCYPSHLPWVVLIGVHHLFMTLVGGTVTIRCRTYAVWKHRSKSHWKILDWFENDENRHMFHRGSFVCFFLIFPSDVAKK